ncbi:MAG: sensor domain-containing diguanylate cyclase [Actinomycetota bacterium]|nr:sensor domain-containing diguanylate cyclase [Actinomycetota bacterium]
MRTDKAKKTYGYMVVSITREFVNDKEERALFLEVAGDIALALENIELEEFERRTEKMMTQTAQKFVDLFNSINDAVFIHDMEGNFLAVNDQACERLGYSKKEFNQLTPADIDSPEFASQVGERIQQLKKDGQVFFESAHISKTGEKVPVELNSRVIEYEGKKAILTVARDITERKKAQEKINRLVFYDSLTSLPNRRLFNDRIDIALGNAHRNQKQVAVAMLDIDDFKEVNDSMGHTAGDELLIKAARKLSSAVRKTDTVARLGGDEFVCLFTNIDNLDGVKKIAKKIIGLMNEPVIIESKEIKATISMGIALYPGDGKTGEELVKKADIALYRIKSAAKMTLHFIVLNHKEDGFLIGNFPENHG